MTEYDYVIVGAGSAGCVLAERLSADGQSTVLLIEAGSENRHPFLSMPRGFAKMWLHPRYFYSFPVKPSPFRPANEAWAYGKGLGGSSAVNGTWYFRGQPKDYDSWAAFDDGLWGWRQIERCYRELEDYSEPGADPSRGRGGPMQVTAIKSASRLTRAILAAGRDMGVATLSDVNQPGVEGMGATQTTVDRKRRRVTSYSAFVRPIRRKRPNLTIRTQTRVDRILFDGQRAIGVQCSARGRSRAVLARKEVLLCAGVLQSPKLLQLSGIGPKSLLEQFQIPIVQANEAVGRNMREHMMLGVSYRLKNDFGLNREFRGWRLWANAAKYFLFRRGVMSFALPEISGMVASRPELSDWPDTQISVSAYSYAASREHKPEPGRGVPERRPGLTASGFCLRPNSRGSVAIRSADPADLPLVDANWFGEESDRAMLLEMIALLRRLMKQPALADFVGEETVPGADCDTDEKLAEASNWLLSTGLHGTATCRMGRKGESVVDARLRVHDVSGLRVVDCSAIPTPISGNTNGPCMAFAWRAAELILEDRDAAQAQAAGARQMAPADQ